MSNEAELDEFMERLSEEALKRYEAGAELPAAIAAAISAEVQIVDLLPKNGFERARRGIAESFEGSLTIAAALGVQLTLQVAIAERDNIAAEISGRV